MPDDAPRRAPHDARTPGGAGVVVVAAGSGSRLGADRPKALVEVAGATLLEHAVRGALLAGVDAVVVVAPASHLAEAEPLLARLLAAAGGTTGALPGVVVVGGAERTDSVGAGLRALEAVVAEQGVALDVVLVHDAARCLTPADVYLRVTAAVRAGAAAAVPGLPVVDTVKVVDEAGVVLSTPQRSSLRAVQTPQAFAVEVLRAAHASGAHASDDAALVEALGHEVVVVEGDPRAFKITDREDLARAARLAAVEA